MIERLEIDGDNFEVTAHIEEYVRKKLGGLDRLLPRHVKKSVHARVILSEIGSRRKLAVCEAILQLPHSTLLAKEANVSMTSSIDIVEDKLARQIRKYKTAHFQNNDRRLLRRLLGRAKRSK